MSIAHQSGLVSRARARAAAAELSAADAGERDFACLVSVTHVSVAEIGRLRTVAGVTGVIDAEDSADIHMIVAAGDGRAARRLCVELLTARVPQCVVTVPDVVDYDHALVAFLEQHGEHPDDEDSWGVFDDHAAVAHVLDRP